MISLAIIVSIIIFLTAALISHPTDGRKGSTPRHHQPAKLIIGVAAIAAGILFLLDQRGIIHLRDFWRLWPVIFILIGIGKLFESNNRDRFVGAGVMFLIGGGWILINYGYFGWQQVWPAALIIFGVMLLIQAMQSRDDAPSGSSDGKLKPYAIFSSVEKNVNDHEFAGGEARTVFGSVEIDLTHAEMKEDTATIYTHVVFGSVEMRVPDTWKVDVQAGAIFGSCENKTRVPLSTASKTLIIRGDILFGSVEIRN